MKLHDLTAIYLCTVLDMARLGPLVYLVKTSTVTFSNFRPMIKPQQFDPNQGKDSLDPELANRKKHKITFKQSTTKHNK